MGFETYQRILSEAMEELGVETGITTRGKEESFVEDCTVETDQPALIPDGYIDVTAEKIRIYKQLDSLTDDREIDRLGRQLEDRFGPLPVEVKNLLDVVKIRNLGQLCGFEKIIVKNGMQIMFFVTNPMSGFYQSRTFERIVGRINDQPAVFKVNQDKGNLRTGTRGVDTMDKALATLRRLQ